MAPPIFLRGAMRFIFQHALLRGAAATPFLSAKFFDARLFRGAAASLNGFDFVEQKPAREGAILTLLPRRLALHLDARRAMKQLHARGGLIDVLSAMSTRADECLFNIRFLHAE